MAGWTDVDRDRARARSREIAEGFPGVVVEGKGEHDGYAVRRKRFAWFVVDHHGDGRLALWVKAEVGEQEALCAEEPERFFVPPYLGPSGWVGVRLDVDVDWGEVGEMLEQGWRLSAGVRAVRAWEASKER